MPDAGYRDQREPPMADLTTDYLGLKLRNPLVVSASPLSRKVEMVQRLEDAGAAAVVMYSLFEEEINHERHELDYFLGRGALSHPEATGYLPSVAFDGYGPSRYLKQLERLKAAVHIPVIASLNGVSAGGWVEYARRIEQAGADALELNLYYVSVDPDLPGIELEQAQVNLVRQAREQVSIPLAVKLSPFYSSIPNMAQRFADAGANGLVLFNRFYQPDLDLERLEVAPRVVFSTSEDLLLPLRWVAILCRRVDVDFALTGGVHTAQDVLKALMAGASVTGMASELLAHGPARIAQMLLEMENWLEEHEYHSVRQMIGSMSQHAVDEPAAFERANYIRALGSLDHRLV